MAGAEGPGSRPPPAPATAHGTGRHGCWGARLHADHGPATTTAAAAATDATKLLLPHQPAPQATHTESPCAAAWFTNNRLFLKPANRPTTTQPPAAGVQAGLRQQPGRGQRLQRHGAGGGKHRQGRQAGPLSVAGRRVRGCSAVQCRCKQMLAVCGVRCRHVGPWARAGCRVWGRHVTQRWEREGAARACARSAW